MTNKLEDLNLRPYQDLSLQDIEGEEWRDIEGFEGYYMVSDMGRVKSLSRYVATRGGGVRKLEEKILKQRCNKKRTFPTNLQVSLKVSISVSHLVILAFVRKRCKDECTVRHLDNNVHNNKPTNLAWESNCYYSDRLLQIKVRKSGGGYKGVAKLISEKNRLKPWRVVFCSKKKNIIESRVFKTELEAAHKYDYYIKKYNLKRKGNFI